MEKSNRIKKLREERGLTQSELAETLHVNRYAVTLWEDNHSLTVKNLCALADVFEVTADYLLGREDDMGNVNVMRELTERERLWLGLYQKLSPKQYDEAVDFINYLISKI